MVIKTVMAAWLVLAPAFVGESPGSVDVTVPGGIVAMTRVLGIERTPDRPQFLAEIVRVLQDTRGRRHFDADATLVRLKAYLDAVTSGSQETIPVPLTSKLWSDALFHRPIADSMLFTAIVSDRRAGLLAHGLAALDDETIGYLSDHPGILSRLYEESAASFAAFGDALRIHGGRVVPPGGADGLAVWESVLGETVTNPDRFVRKVFGASHGRVALVYAALTHLDAPHVRFALGSWLPDPAARVGQFKVLLAASAARHEWDVDVQPFSRPIHDVTLLLTRVRVQPTGAPLAPAARLFWERAFEAADIPVDSALRPKSPVEAGVVDAGWFAEHIVSVQPPGVRADRLDQLSFAQRAFAATPVSQLPDALVAVRSLTRFRMLMLTLERMGVRDTRVYAAAARQASHLMSLSGRRGFLALGQFQGALAVIDRLVRVHRLTASAAEALAGSAASVALQDDGAYHGGMARWIERALAPALQWPAGADADRELVVSLAGVQDTKAALTRVAWEGQTYRVDLVMPERDRLTRAREKMGSPSVSAALELEHVATALSAPSLSAADVRVAASVLVTIGAALPSADRKTLLRAIADLSKIAPDTDLKKAAAMAESVSALSDDLLAQALMSLAYALEIGDPDGTTLMGGDLSRRHDFGLDNRESERRIHAAWAEPRDVAMSGTPRHVEGSLLGLDLGLSSLSLRRIDAGEVPPPPTLILGQREGFIKTVALINPFDLTDSGRDAIVSAMDRGRARVAALSNDGSGWDEAADEIRMDAWRRRAGRWALAHDAGMVPSLFSLAELVHLGAPAPDLPLDAWGMARLASDGCLCTTAPLPGRVSLVSGRTQLGLMATEVADLNLRVAERLSRLHLPASLARGVLFAAVQDFVDRARPNHPNDWLTLVRDAQAIPDDRIDDYVAALTAEGPLVRDRSTTAAVREPRSW